MSKHTPEFEKTWQQIEAEHAELFEALRKIVTMADKHYNISDDEFLFEGTHMNRPDTHNLRLRADDLEDKFEAHQAAFALRAAADWIDAQPEWPKDGSGNLWTRERLIAIRNKYPSIGNETWYALDALAAIAPPATEPEMVEVAVWLDDSGKLLHNYHPVGMYVPAHAIRVKIPRPGP